MRRDLDLRRLRYFVAVAEELHFTRAARRLHVAQQAVSREVRALEDDLGVALLDRTTRRVALTAAGELLLVRARELLISHDRLRGELAGHHRPLIVDVVGEQLTPYLVVRAARAESEDVRIVVRTGGGLAAALPGLLGGAIDVAFGHLDPAETPSSLESRLVRREPYGLLLPEDHPLARLERIPTARLRGLTVDISSGNPNATEWTALGEELLNRYGARPSPPHPHVVGAQETSHHLYDQGVPILSHTIAPAVPGGVVRPLADPVPYYPWRMLWTRGARHPALTALHRAVDRLTTPPEPPAAVRAVRRSASGG